SGAGRGPRTPPRYRGRPPAAARRHRDRRQVATFGRTGHRDNMMTSVSGVSLEVEGGAKPLHDVVEQGRPGSVVGGGQFRWSAILQRERWGQLFAPPTLAPEMCLPQTADDATAPTPPGLAPGPPRRGRADGQRPRRPGRARHPRVAAVG